MGKTRQTCDLVSDNNIFVDITNDRVGIGTDIPTKVFDVVGGDAVINGITVGLGLAEVASNTVVGKDALNANTSGANNVAIGKDALGANTTGGSNTASVIKHST